MVDFTQRTPKLDDWNPVKGITEELVAEKMSSGQRSRESGDRQFGANGETLVGRYRDGSMPSPEKRAYGTSQMQIGTAREAAQRAGIPWDQNRFMKDKEYNARLGDAHMDYLRSKYGSEDLAQGAYHSGEGAVDRAIRKYGRANFDRGLGPEGRNYVAAARRESGSGGGAGGGSVTDVRSVQATQEEKDRLARPKEFAVVNPFEVDGRAGAASQKVNERRTGLDEYIQAELANLNGEQEAAEEMLRKSNATRAAIRDEVTQRTEQLVSIGKPIFQKRAAISDRIGEIAEMNPFQRFIKGTFDPAYNLDELQGRNRLLDAQLGILEEDYKRLNSYQGVLMDNIAQGTADGMNLFQMLQTHRLQDLQLMGHSVSAAEAEMGGILEDLNLESGIERAQLATIQSTLSQLSLGQLNEAANNVVDGVAIVNGIEVSENFIQEALDNKQDREYNIQARELALQNQQAELAERSMGNIIKTMTPEEINAAVAANGEFQGYQLDIVALTERQQQIRAARVQQTENQEIAGAAGAAPQLIKGFTQQAVLESRRITGLLGTAPTEFTQIQQADILELKKITEGIKQAQKAGNVEEYLASVGPRIQQLQERRAKVIDRAISTWAGGNKDLARLGTAWMQGTPLNNREAAIGLLTLARDGTPKGVNLTGPAANALRAAEAILRQRDAADANAAADGGFAAAMKGTAKKPKGFTDEEIQQVTAAARSSYNGTLVDDALQSLPELTREFTKHPFGKVKGSDFRRAIHLGDEEGYAIIAREMGVEPGVAKRVFTNGAARERWQTANPGVDLGQLESRLLASQTLATFKYLDDIATDGFSPAAAWADAMADPELQTSIRNQLQANGGNSFGDFVTSAAAGGRTNEQFANYATHVNQAFVSYKNDQARRNRAEATDLWGMPEKRTKFILGAIPGINRAEEDALYKAIRQSVPQGFPPVDPLNPNHHQISEGNMAIEAFIMNQKLDDPKLESIRKRAAAGWKDISSTVDRGYSRVSGGN